jgi:hypothetical protein
LEKIFWFHHKIFQKRPEVFSFPLFFGVRFSDLKNLKNSTIYFENGNPIISLKQLKTTKLVEIPLGSKAQKYLPEKGQHG